MKLSDDERALARRLPDKAVYVAVLHFFRGPRGGRYRPVRTHAHATEAGALRELDRLREGRWRVCPSHANLVLVDQLGNVLAEERTW
jgi:hypothetical protein